jgi:uncharacterized damage-inducible protein DinB
MMHRHFIKLFEYEKWANSVLENMMQQAGSQLPTRALFLYSHILSSHSMWLNRFRNEPIVAQLFQERTLPACQVLMTENHDGWLRHLQTMPDEQFENVIAYTNALTGESQKMVISDALTHLIMHSAHHRAQIIVLFKGIIEPLPLINYIMYAARKV